MKILLIYPSNPYYNSQTMPMLSMDHFCLKSGAIGNLLMRFYSKIFLDKKVKLNFQPLLYPHIALLSLRNLSPTHEVDLHDDYVDLITEKHLNSFAKYDLIGINVLTQSAKRSYELYNLLKPLNIPIAMGGPHISALPEHAEKHCDILCIGPAETYWQELLSDVKKGQVKKMYRARYDPSMINRSRYYSLGYEDFHSFGYLPVTIPVFSRGCNNHCSFCFIPDFRPKWHSRDMDKLVQDILKANNRHVFFVDANLAPDKETFKVLLKKLRSLKGAGIYWSGNTSLDLFDEDTPGLLKESNCSHVNIGIESLTSLEKKIPSVKFAENIIHKLHHVGITIKGCFILGYIKDTKNSFEAIEKFIIGNGLDFFDIASLVPYPGTHLYKSFQVQGMLETLDYDNYIIESDKLVFRHPLKNYSNLFNSLLFDLYSIKNLLLRLKNGSLFKKNMHSIFYVLFVNIVSYFSIKSYKASYRKNCKSEKSYDK